MKKREDFKSDDEYNNYRTWRIFTHDYIDNYVKAAKENNKEEMDKILSKVYILDFEPDMFERELAPRDTFRTEEGYIEQKLKYEAGISIRDFLLKAKKKNNTWRGKLSRFLNVSKK